MPSPDNNGNNLRGKSVNGATPVPQERALRFTTWGELRQTPGFDLQRLKQRRVKDEMRENLLRLLRSGETIFPGIVGYDDTVLPQVINAILSRHNFILLGLRGQAKTRLLRSLTRLLDAEMPAVAGCEIRDNPAAPLCARCRALLAKQGDDTPIVMIPAPQRYIEKLATPDVTIADLIGDIDPIKAARGGHDLASELTIHYGLLPRAHRGIFAVNELPDLAGKIQVGLFNIMQEGDVQIKGYPVRLPLDLALVFSANPEDYTARGKIVTPLKDRIGSEIRTHYPASIEEGMAITLQESELERGGAPVVLPDFVREVIEAVAFCAREDKRVDQRSGVSQRLAISCLENTVSNAERRALLSGDDPAVPRLLDVHSSLPALTGKIELEYEGEMKGAEVIARDLIRAATARVFNRIFTLQPAEPTTTPVEEWESYSGMRRAASANTRDSRSRIPLPEGLEQVVQWFDLGGTLDLAEAVPAHKLLPALQQINGLERQLKVLGVKNSDPAGVKVAAAEFILEGLWAHKRISRKVGVGYHSEPTRREAATARNENPGRNRRPLN